MNEEWVLHEPGQRTGAEDGGEGDPFFSVRPFAFFECYTKFIYIYSSKSVFKQNREKWRLPTERAYDQIGEINFNLQGKI